MNQHQLIDRVTSALTADNRVRALFLSGSFGRGTEDQFSDVDFLALADPADHESLAADWRPTLEAIAPIVYFNRLPWALVLNAITEQWLRVDLNIVAADHFVGYAQDRLRPLIDRDNLHATLPAALPDRGIDPRRLEAITLEFIRILGLLPVGLGRGETELIAAGGTGYLRKGLTDLLILEADKPNEGALHLSKVIGPDRLAVLAAIPLAELSDASAIAANLALARAFFPRAKALYSGLGLDWPTAFEAATRAHLCRNLPASSQPDW